jgi:hypothetical protein
MKSAIVAAEEEVLRWGSMAGPAPLASCSYLRSLLE